MALAEPGPGWPLTRPTLRPSPCACEPSGSQWLGGVLGSGYWVHRALPRRPVFWGWEEQDAGARAGMGVGEGGELAPLQEAMVLSWSISFLLLFFHDCFTLF